MHFLWPNSISILRYQIQYWLIQAAFFPRLTCRSGVLEKRGWAKVFALWLFHFSPKYVSVQKERAIKPTTFLDCQMRHFQYIFESKCLYFDPSNGTSNDIIKCVLISERTINLRTFTLCKMKKNNALIIFSNYFLEIDFIHFLGCNKIK